MNHQLYPQIPQKLIENFTMRPFFKSEKREDCWLYQINLPLGLHADKHRMLCNVICFTSLGFSVAPTIPWAPTDKPGKSWEVTVS